MNNFKWRSGFTLILLMVGLLVIIVPKRAWAAEYDLKPVFGPSIEQTIRAVIPSQYLKHVTTDRLTLDDKGTVRGQITIQYEERKLGIKLWSARVVIHWTTHYANPAASDVTVDIGPIKGVINTASVKNTVAGWLKQQQQHLEKYLNQKPYAVLCIRNETNRNIEFIYHWGESTAPKIDSVNSGKARWYSWKYAPGSASSPPFIINFGTSNGERKQYELKRYQAYQESCSEAKVYVFKNVGNNKIDLFSED